MSWSSKYEISELSDTCVQMHHASVASAKWSPKHECWLLILVTVDEMSVISNVGSLVWARESKIGLELRLASARTRMSWAENSGCACKCARDKLKSLCTVDYELDDDEMSWTWMMTDRVRWNIWDEHIFCSWWTAKWFADNIGTLKLQFKMQEDEFILDDADARISIYLQC